MPKTKLARTTWLVVFGIVVGLNLSVVHVSAQLTVKDPTDFGLQAIKLPTFLSLDQIQNFSVLSYVAIVIDLLILVMAVVWVSMVIRGAVQVLRSEGNEEEIGKGRTRITRVLMGISAMFVFVVLISVVASFFGVGNFWEWPKAFSTCKQTSGGVQTYYYFQYSLLPQNSGKPISQIEQECFNGGATATDTTSCYTKCISGKTDSADLAACKRRCGGT